MSQIATFGTMAAKAAMRDVGRVLDIGYMFCDGIAKLIPYKPGKHGHDRRRDEGRAAACRSASRTKTKCSSCSSSPSSVEGITRNIGMHAGGVLIAPGKLTDFCPLYTQGGDSGA